MSTQGRTPRSTRRKLARAAGALAGGGLALFHLWLFAGRLRDLSIAEPRVLASWLASAALGAFALHLKRRGSALVGGRSGLVFWLLVLLLHLGLTPAGSALATVEPALGLELAAFALAIATATALGLLRPEIATRPLFAADAVRAPRAALAGGPLAAPRPPPSR